MSPALLLLLGLSAAPAPEAVRAGVFLENVESVDLQSDAYSLRFLLWLRWTGEGDPLRTLRFRNALDAWALVVTPASEQPEVLPDGSRYRRLLVDGRFFNKFDLGPFPLDRQEIAIELVDAVRTADQLRFVADEGSGAVAGLQIPGWRVGPARVQTREVAYPGGLGLGPGEARFSTLRFSLRIERPATMLLYTILPPILLVLACAYLVFFLRPVHVDARVSTVITALLAEIFLQLAFTDDIPYLGISVLLDQLFNFSYLVMTAMLVECVVVIRWYDRIPQADADLASKLSARLASLERAARIAFPALYAIGCLAIVLAGRAA